LCGASRAFRQRCLVRDKVHELGERAIIGHARPRRFLLRGAHVLGWLFSMATEVTNNETQRDDVQDAAGSGVQSSDSEVTNNEAQRDDVQDAAGGGVQSSGSEVTNNETQRDDVQDAAGSGVQSSDSEVTEKRPDLIWDDEAHGLCIRVYGDGSKSFIVVYRIEDRQRFIRIGRSPRWTLEAARTRAKEARSIIDQGRDPAGEKL